MRTRLKAHPFPSISSEGSKQIQRAKTHPWPSRIAKDACTGGTGKTSCLTFVTWLGATRLRLLSTKDYANFPWAERLVAFPPDVNTYLGVGQNGRNTRRRAEGLNSRLAHRVGGVSGEAAADPLEPPRRLLEDPADGSPVVVAECEVVVEG